MRMKKIKLFYFLSAKLLAVATLAVLVSTASCRKNNDPMPSDPPKEQASRIYVANENGESITVIDGPARKVIATISLNMHNGDMPMPHNVQVAPDGKMVWLTCNSMTSEMDQLVGIEVSSNTITKRIDLGRSLHLAHVVLDDKSRYAFVTATNTHEVYQVDLSKDSIINIFNLRSKHQPHGIRYYNGKLYVANMASGTMSIITVSDGSIKEVSIGGAGMQTAICPNGQYAFITVANTRQLVRYDMHSGETIHIPLPDSALGPVQAYPTPDSKYLYICDQGMMYGMGAGNHIFVLDIAANKMIRAIQVGRQAHGVVISRDGKYAYVTNKQDDTISIIDLNTQEVTCTIAVGPSPNGISYWCEAGGMP